MQDFGEDKLRELLLSADRAFPAPIAKPATRAAILRRVARRAAERWALLGAAAAVALFAALSKPSVAPFAPGMHRIVAAGAENVTAVGAKAVVLRGAEARADSDREIAALSRQADLMRRTALTIMAERGQDRRTADITPPDLAPVTGYSADS